MRLNPRFTLQEYVSKAVFERDGDRAVRYISTALIEADLQLILDLEEHFGRPVSCTINSWKWGGNRQYSGLRMPEEPNYKKWSLHSMGSASDKQFKYKDGNGEVLRTEEVYDLIIHNQARYYKLGIRRIEDIAKANTWIHWDTGWTPSMYLNKLMVVS